MSTGRLYIVATPIGHLADLSARAVQTLQDVDLIACEDTRHSKKLLFHFSIQTPLMALHDHNERDQVGQLLQNLKDGQSVALISDAGTPLISDPGYRLVKAAHEADIIVSPIPGACAAMAALSVAGLPSDRFYFEGFLSAKQVARMKRLSTLEPRLETLIFYEAPHRLLDTLSDMCDVFGGTRQVTLARELTKLHETIRLMPLSDLYEFAKADHNQCRGEIVLVVAGKESDIDSHLQEALRVYEILHQELSTKQAVVLAAKVTGVKKNQLYDVVIGSRKANPIST